MDEGLLLVGPPPTSLSQGPRGQDEDREQDKDSETTEGLGSQVLNKVNRSLLTEKRTR